MAAFPGYEHHTRLSAIQLISAASTCAVSLFRSLWLVVSRAQPGAGLGAFRWLSLLCFSAVVSGALSGCKTPEPPRIVFSTPAEGISQITVRAWKAPAAKVIEEQRATIEVSGLPSLAANGFHDPSPAGREKPAEQMPFEFNLARYGSVAIISSKGELVYPHHHYCLDAIEIHIPKGMRLMRERQMLAAPAKHPHS